jgi:exodeoxyribonuclease VII large subunit
MSNLAIPEGVKVRSVSDLTSEVKALLEEGFPSVWVAGEVSDCKKAGSGHVYLILKDAKAQLRAALWRGVALRLKFDLKNGQEVVARGRLSLYAPWGEYRLEIEEVIPKGIGVAELALQQLLQKLFRLGYFDPKRKKPLPAFPRRVALVTSPTGAAVRDMLQILGRRWPAAEVWVCPVRVQGEPAPEQITEAIRLLNRVGGVDVIILGRGGGSAEDLSTFNAEIVARAIYESRVPVVSAVGHEIDVTVADRVADKRAATPSEAAELVTPDRQELLEQLQADEARLKTLLGQRLEQTCERLRLLQQRRVFRFPLERVRDLERRLDDLQGRLARGMRQRLGRAQQQVEALAGRLQTLSPLNVLGRGYSLTRTESTQEVVRRAEQVRPGDSLVTIVQHGRIVSRVERTEST